MLAKKSKILFYFVLLKVLKKIEKMSESHIFAHFLFFGERCEWIAHFAQIKWAMWANRSFCSPKMSDHERFAQDVQRKWAMWANHAFRSPKMSEWVNRLIFLSESLICSFFEKKWAILLDIKWANSQPWTYLNLSLFLENASLGILRIEYLGKIGKELRLFGLYSSETRIAFVEEYKRG